MSTHRDGKKISVYHATAPTCWWSWGYEATLNRISLVYGDQVAVHLMIGTVYDNIQEWLKNYGMAERSWAKWAEESSKIMGVPIRTRYTLKGEPRSVLPATHAVLAAERQGDRKKAARFMRELLRLFVVEGTDVTNSELLISAAKEAGLDTKRFKKDFENTPALKSDMEHQGHGFPEVPLGFYNLAVSDGEGRIVLLDNGFEPKIVEGAIDYLSENRLTKSSPPVDFEKYLAEHGAAPLAELARVFALSEGAALKRLSGLEHESKIEKVALAGAPHWRTIAGRRE